ncbi:MAG TPA: xanthine dehydrogenase family protein molybdopterin-binding subunit [Candidatus Tectomicrobia bacterium]|nr:xanthine dehydrogenase family protein molybdopterin-binding subunit [Candidatus Tectomicrobia bacterium]
MSYVGQPVKRFEDPKLITGRGSFVDDIKLPDMLHAAVLRSPYAHARIRSIDISAARDLPGVVAILTGADIAGVLPDIPTRAMTGERAVDELRPPEHPLLARDKVCYVGQAVAVVVALNPSVAADAVERIAVDYEPLSPVLDPHAAAREDAPIIHETMGTNVALRLHQRAGDLDGAFAGVDHVIRQRYLVPRLAPAPLETRGVVASYQAQENLLTVWNSTQAAQRVKHYLSGLLNQPEHTLRVIAPDVGGSFGVKDCIFPEDVLVPYLALRLGRPVKWIEERRENMLAYHGRGMSLDIEAAVRRDGVILGIRVHVVADIGAYFLLTTSSAPFNAVRRITGPYHIPAVDLELVGVVTNKTPTGAYRGTGSPEAAFCLERTMDLIAKDLELDPAEVRRRNFIPPDAFPYQSAAGLTYDSGQYAQGLERALELVDYAGWRDKARQRKPDDPLLGIGLATFTKSSGAAGDHRIESARVAIEPSGQITVFTGISPHGQGNATAFAQLVADELGVDPSQVQVRHGDTATVPFGEGTSASRGLIVGGSAVHAALQEARQTLARLAAQLFSCAAEDVCFQGGRLYNRQQPEARMTFAQLATAAYAGELLPAGVDGRLDFSARYTLPSAPISFGAHAVVVEVDRDTGEVKILRYVGVHDCGRIVNPKLVEGQILGGMAQGIGQALSEGMVYSEEGQPLTGSLLDYAIPKAPDMPELILDTLETPSPTNPLGAKGIGSVSTVPPPAALANAVVDALSGFGVRHLDTPLTAEKVWRAMQEVSKGRMVSSAAR